MKLTSAALAILFLASGCMGTAPKPIESYQYGDDKKNCSMLQGEVSECESKIVALEKKRKGKVGGNIAIGAVGAILFWPALLFLDTKSDEQTEIEALLKRRRNLANIAVDNGCEWCAGKDFSDSAFMVRVGIGDKAAKPSDVEEVKIDRH